MAQGTPSLGITRATVLCALLAGVGSSAATAQTPTATKCSGQFACGPEVTSAACEVFEPTIADISDQRLQGDVSLSRNVVEYAPEEADLADSIETDTWQIVNVEGSWPGSSLTFGLNDELGPDTEIITLVGGGWSVRGLIVDGSLPEFLAPPAT